MVEPKRHMNATKNLIELKLYMNPTKNLIEPKLYMNLSKNLIEAKLYLNLTKNLIEPIDLVISGVVYWHRSRNHPCGILAVVS